MAVQPECVTIGTISGGIVNFGGAIYISPITITKTTSGDGGNNSGSEGTENSGMNSSNQNLNHVKGIFRAMLG